MKKRISLIAALMVFFAMTAVSFAANTANINVTSEPITFHALCDKAGGLALSFDDNTTFVAGDQITADLPLNVSLCKDIDFVIGMVPLGGAAGADDPEPYVTASFAGGVLPALGSTVLGPITGEGTIASAGNGVAFWVRGSKGSQRIFIEVVTDVTNDGNLDVGENLGHSLTFSATAGLESSAKMVISLLDQRVYTTDSNIYTDNNLAIALSSTDSDYNDVATADQNTLCINVSLYDGEYVKLSFDSKADKYTWVPSDPQVAHVVASQVIAFAPCTKNVCGYINGPETAGQTGFFCNIVDNEGPSPLFPGTGYCDVAPRIHDLNKLIIQETSGNPFAGGNYQVQLEILVDGVGGDQGAYFSTDVAVEAFATSTLACDNAAAVAAVTYLYNAANEVNVLNADTSDASALNAALAFAPADQDCTIAAVNKITKVKTGLITPFNGTDQDFLWIDIPTIVYDRTLFTDGETLTVKATLLKAPCGQIFEGEWCVGTLGCPTIDEDDCFEYSRVYPYFGKNGAYINIFGITNTSDADGTYAVTIYEKDGDIFTATVAVGAHKISANLLHSLTVATVDNAGGGTFGDEQSYVTVKGDTAFEGIIYVTNAATGQSFSGSPSDLVTQQVVCP